MMCYISFRTTSSNFLPVLRVIQGGVDGNVYRYLSLITNTNNQSKPSPLCGILRFTRTHRNIINTHRNNTLKERLLSRS
jgi:hypothetical protein